MTGKGYELDVESGRDACWLCLREFEGFEKASKAESQELREAGVNCMEEYEWKDFFNCEGSGKNA